jgi:hypothetical protein
MSRSVFIRDEAITPALVRQVATHARRCLLLGVTRKHLDDCGTGQVMRGRGSWPSFRRLKAVPARDQSQDFPRLSASKGMDSWDAVVFHDPFDSVRSLDELLRVCLGVSSTIRRAFWRWMLSSNSSVNATDLV